jgi:hypothetical protein
MTDNKYCSCGMHVVAFGVCWPLLVGYTMIGVGIVGGIAMLMGLL